MKKVAAIFVIVIILVYSGFSSFAAGLALFYDGALHEYNGEIYSIKVNGEPVTTDVPCILINDRTLVPVRAVFEKLGAEVRWDDANQKVYVILNGINVELKINDNVAIVGNKQVSMDVPAKIINDRTMVPIRFIAEQLNLKVGWHPQERLVTVDNVSIGIITQTETLKTYDVVIPVEGCKNYNVMRLDSPDRLVIDIPNVLAPEQQQRIDVKNGIINAVRYAQFENKTARIVLDVSGQPDYEIEQKPDSLIVHVKKPDLPVQDGQDSGALSTSNLSYEKYAGSARLLLKGVNENPANTDAQPFTQMYDATGKIHVIKFSKDIINAEKQILNINDDMLRSVEIAKVESTGEVCLIFNAVKKLNYDVIYRPGMDIAVVIITASDLSDQGDGRIPFINSSSITHTANGGSEEIVINAPGYRSYKTMRSEGPDRVLLDISEADAPQKESIDINSALIKTISLSKYDDNTARIVVDMCAPVQYSVYTMDGKIVIKLESAGMKNLIYYNYGDRAHFILKNTKLTEGGRVLTNLYTGEYDETGTIYTINFPSYLGALESGKLEINDDRLNSVEVVNDGQQTKIVINAKKWFVYNIITRYNDYGELIDTAINVLSPASREDKLVVIDPGHGGLEFGAVYAGVNEKDLNLDIALRLDALLKSKGVNTYMIREDDSYVGLYERAYIANDLNALLFLSIHNNAFDTRARGTETLFYPSNSSGFNGRRFAQIIEGNLTSTLNTYYRGIVERPNLVVLKATAMTAALAEIAFMDNEQDRAMLLTEDFRQKAAEALCASIIQALSEIE